ncbi:MAG: lipopolysaccharide kinase InaA family protein [Phycisphaerae bacterium]
MTNSNARACGGGIRWTVASGWEECITGPAAPDWPKLAESDLTAVGPALPVGQAFQPVDQQAGKPVPQQGGVLIKSNPVRRVWRFSIAGRKFFVKVYMRLSAFAGIRRLLRGSDARREWRAGRWAQRNDVPTVRFVAYGRGGGRCYLVSEAVRDAKTLSESWLQGTDKWALLRAVADLLAAAHDAGFVHGDEHPNNILVFPAEGRPCGACYVDIYSARLGWRVSKAEAAQSLAQLNQWFSPRTSRRRRLRFLGAYCLRRAHGDTREARAMMRRLGPLIAEASQRQAERLWRKRDRRILRSNRYFTAIQRADGWSVHAVIRFRQPDLFPSPSVLPGAVSEWTGARAQARGSEDGLETACEIEGAIRQTAAMMLDAGVTVCVRQGSSLPRSAFVMGHRLRHRDLPCRWPIAVADGPDEKSGVLWVDASPAAEDLVAFLKQRSEHRAARRRAAESLADVVSSMADRGASVQQCCRGTFGVVPGKCTVVIDAPLNVLLRSRDPNRDLRTTSRALYEHVKRCGVFRRTDAACYLKALSSKRWRALWKSIATAVTER